MENLFIADKNTLASFLRISKDFNFDDFKSTLAHAQRRYIRKILGKELYNKCFDSDNPMDPDLMATLTAQINPALAQLAYFLYVSIHQVNISSGGIHALEGDTQKRPYRWQIEMLEISLLQNGHNLLESLIEFLDDNIEDFELWKESRFYKRNTSMLLSSSADLEEFLPKYSGRLVYMALFDSIQYIEDFTVRPLLCDYYDELVAKKHKKEESELSDSDNLILPFLLNAISRLSVAHGMHTLSVEINVFGVIEQKKDDRNAHLMFEQSSPENRQLIVNSMRTSGQNYLDKVKQLIHKNIDDFETYKESPCYVAESSTIRTGNVDQMRPEAKQSFFRT
jgi:hypothetical protein